MVGTLNKPIKAMILDMDGVLWRDNEPIGNLPRFFSLLSEAGVSVVLATNNSTRTVSQYLEKLKGFGVSLEAWQIITSSQVAAHHLSHLFPLKGGVFVVGESSLVETLEEAGFPHTQDNPVAVVAGLDRFLTYKKLSQATRFIRNGVPFIGTNPDRTLPTPEGLVPGAGSVLAALQAASDVKPVIVGKPSPEIYQIALQRLSVPPNETLVVGDRPETDMAGGQQIGCQTALVLSGVVDRRGAEAWQPAPNLITDNLESVIKFVLGPV